MRYIKLVLLVVSLTIAALFFIQNQALLLSTLGLKVDLYVVKFLTPAVPLYGVIISAFVLGMVLSLIFLLIDKIHCSSQLRSCRKRLRSLEEEVTSLRNLPLQDKDPLNASAKSDSLTGGNENMGA